LLTSSFGGWRLGDTGFRWRGLRPVGRSIRPSARKEFPRLQWNSFKDSFPKRRYAVVATRRDRQSARLNSGSALAARFDIYAPAIAIEFHVPVNKGKNGIVASETDISSRQKLGAALAKNNVAGDNGFSTEPFHTESFTRAVAPILDAALSLLMSHKPELCADGFDLKPRQQAAMTHGAMVAFAALVFEGNNLGRLLLLNHLSGDGRARNQWGANRNALPVGNQEDLVKLCLRTRLDVELLNLDYVAFRDAVLLASCLYDCVCHEIASSVGTCENPTPLSRQQAKFFPCAAQTARPISSFRSCSGGEMADTYV
jgi:hypothetical protein